jgi:hypothetical protein
LPRSDAPREIILELGGYQLERIQIRPTADLDRNVELFAKPKPALEHRSDQPASHRSSAGGFDRDPALHEPAREVRGAREKAEPKDQPEKEVVPGEVELKRPPFDDPK